MENKNGTTKFIEMILWLIAFIFALVMFFIKK